jgi:hypothetical protein
VVAQRRDAAVGRRPTRDEPVEVLRRRRQAVEGAGRLAVLAAALELARRDARLLERLEDERVEARVARLDALAGRVQHLQRGEPAGADARGQLGRGDVGELVGEGHAPHPKR